MTPTTETSTSGTIRQAVDLRSFPGIRRLAADYAEGTTGLLDFYAGHPGDPGAWRRAIERARAHPRDRAALCDALLAQLHHRAAPPEACAAVERLRDPGTVVIITGQQAGLFGGPMYTLLKAITAIKLAARVRQQFHVEAEAIFWIDSEDHDWNEVNGCEVLDADLQPKQFRLPDPPGAGELPVARLPLDHSVTACLDELAAVLPPTEFSGTLLTRLRSAYRPGAGMSDAFGRLLEFVLGELGLIVYDAADPATKPLVASVFNREIAYTGRTADRATETGRQLEERGYHAQVVSSPGHVSLFHLDGGRAGITAIGERFAVGGRSLDLKALTALTRSQPALFSPNVLLRPIVQDALFPTIAYVAGPNELAYLGQLKPVYEDFGVPMPLMYPRATATLLDSAALRFLGKYDVALADLQARDESTLNRLLEAQLPPEVEQSFSSVEAAITDGMHRLVAAVPAVDPTLEGAARSVAGKIHHELQNLHHKIINAAKKRDETLRRQFSRTQAQAFPGGHAQERSTAFIYFLNRYGPGLVDRLLNDLPVEPGAHWILTV